MTLHTQDTLYPQTYTEHMRVALRSSARLIWLGLAGMVHAILPEIKCLQFFTSTGIIKLYRELVQSGRHNKEIMLYGPRRQDWK